MIEGPEVVTIADGQRMAPSDDPTIGVPPADQAVVDLLERIVVGGVAITTRALELATPADGPDLTFPQWRVLLILGATDMGASISAMAARVGVTVPATSRQLRRLAERGLVRIDRSDIDARAARARLTELGVQVRQDIIAARRAELARIAARAGIDRDGVTVLERIADGFDANG